MKNEDLKNRFYKGDHVRFRLNLQFFADQSEDKTEEPTPHRLREARRRGQVFKSMEMNAAVNMLGMALFFLIFWEYFMDGFYAIFQYYMRDLPVEVVGNFSADYITTFSLYRYITLAAPFLLVAMFLGVASNLMQVGFLVSSEVLKPQANRLNPAEGAKRIFSRRALFELAKSLIKIIIVGAVCFFYLRGELSELLVLAGQDINALTSSFGRVLLGLAFRVAAVFFFISFLDFLYQRYEYWKNLRMSRREVKEEHKQLEGDPHVRSKLREKQRNMVQQRSLEDVPDSTVVVTNPTELSIALRYEEEVDSAPVVAAKGSGRLATRIREIARENDIPVIEDPPLAQVLYNQVEIGQEIPVELYQAVAEILAVVYRMKEQESRPGSA